MILEYSIIVFFTQLVFIGTRTWNVKAIAAHNIPQVLLSGAIVHLSWLVGIAISSISMYEIINDFKWENLIIVAFSLTGGLFGSYLALIEKWSSRKI